jgi:hypothetical protein
MLLSKIDPQDLERAKAVKDIKNINSNTFPRYILNGNKLCTPSFRVRSNKNYVEMTDEFPLLVSDLQDVKVLIKRVGLQDSTLPIVFCGKLYKIDAPEVRVLLTNFTYTVGDNDDEDCPISYGLGYKLADNACWVSTYNLHLIEEVLRRPYIESNVSDDERLRLGWINTLCHEIDKRVVLVRRDIKRAEEKLMHVSITAGPVLLAQKMLHSMGEQHLKIMLQAIKDLPDVVSVKPVDACSILITSGPVRTDEQMYQGKHFPARYSGTWEIKIAVDTRMVIARNIAAPTHKFQCLHQADATDSYTCLGDYSEPIRVALRNLDLVKLVMYTMQYLRSFSPEDGRGYNHYNDLPKAKTPPKDVTVFEKWLTIVGAGND